MQEKQGVVMEIKVVETNEDLRNFILLPWKVYEGDPYWVPPLITEVEYILDPKKSPFWEHAHRKLFLVKSLGRVIGRIAGIVDQRHIDFHDEQVGFFGFFECLNDYEIAELLLSQVREWLREKRMKAMRGPINPSQNEECGLLIDAFDSSPMIMMTYNPKYYVGFMEKFGLRKARDLYAYYAPILPEPPKLLLDAAEYARKKHPNVKIRMANLKKFEKEKEIVKEIYNTAWEKNWGFVPMTDREFDSLARRLKSLIVPELTLFIEVDGKTVGLGLALPDYNQALKKINGRLFPFGWLKLLYHSKKIKTLRLIILGVLKEYRMEGLEALLYLEGDRNAHKLGYEGIECSWVLEDNHFTRRACENFDGKVYKTYRIYEMKI
jgi:hypothetical protein